MRITSHEIGWRPSIERFGVSLTLRDTKALREGLRMGAERIADQASESLGGHHGIKRDPAIWPDY